MESLEVTADIGTWKIEATVSFSPDEPLNYSVTSMSAHPYREDGSLGESMGFDALKLMDEADMRAFEISIDKAIEREGDDYHWEEVADAWKETRPICLTCGGR